MKKAIILLSLFVLQVSLFAQKYFPDGTRWTEIRLDTLEHNSWYSKIDGEWVPNFETIEYYVQGEYDDGHGYTYKYVYTNGPEWTDSLTLLIMEMEQNDRVWASLLIDFGNGKICALPPAETYQFDWSIGRGLYYKDFMESTSTSSPPVYYYYGIINEIKEGDFGGIRPLKYVDLDGKAPYDPQNPGNTDTKGARIIQGIGVAEWKNGECLFGPANPYRGLEMFDSELFDSEGRYKYPSRNYRSMLVHFERNGEVLYDVWPRKGSAVEVAIDGLNYFLNLKTHEAVIIPGNNCSGEVDIPSEVSYNDETFTVKSMTYNAFLYNSELTKVKIPKSIESIRHSYPYDPDDEDAPTGMVSPDHMNPFCGCSALESIEVDEENPSMKSVDGVLFSKDGTRLYCYPIGKQPEVYTIPDAVEWIGASAFEGSQNLTTLTIPSGVTYIGECAFADCNNFTDVYCHADSVPSTEAWVFYDTPIASATLHVPAGSVDKYKTTSPWSEFGNIVALPTSDTFIHDIAWVDGFGYEVEGYKIDDVKLFYYTTAGDTLINDKTYFRILRTRKCKTSYKLEEDAKGNEYVADKELITQDDTLCFYMREDDAGDVWFYTEDKNVFYEISHNTLYEYIADNLVRRDLFLYNAKKKYTLGDNLPMGMSILSSPDGFIEGDDYWKICSSEVCKIDKTTLLDGNTYIVYDAWFLEKLGPLIGGPLFGIGEPNSYNLDLKQLFAFYKDGQLIYRNEGYLSALEVHFPNILDAVIGKSSDVINEPVTFTAGQIATIILPTEPDVSKGKYYRLDRVEEGKIIFEQELQPRAHIPYIIVPSEDFSIDLSTLDLAGCYRDTVSVDDVSFIGSYVSEAFDYQDGFYIDIIDTTPDCRFDEFCVIGALRAYLLVRWDDPYNQGGTKVPPLEKLEVVLHDYGTSLASPLREKGEGAIYDLQGRLLPDKPSKGIYIENRHKRMIKN